MSKKKFSKNRIGLGLVIIAIFLVCTLFQTVQAEDEIDKQVLPTSSSYLWVKAKEFVQLNLFTWKKTSKTKVLGDFTNQRINEMNYAQSIDDEDAIDLSLSRYEWQKTKELQYFQDVNNEAIRNRVKEQTLEQQREMTQLQLNLENSGEMQKNVVKVQKNVANQTKEMVRVVEGEEGAAQVDIQTRYIWIDPNADASGNLPPLTNDAQNWEYAPGTNGRDTTGKVIDIQITTDTENTINNNVEIKEETDVDNSTESNKVIDTTTESGSGNSGDNNVKVDTNQGSGNSGGSQNTIIEE